MKEDDKKTYKVASRFIALGLEMGISIGLGYFIGDYIDHRLDTSPYFTIFFFIVGVGAAFKAVYSAVKGFDL